MKNVNQLRALARWEFEFNEETNDYRMEFENLVVCWSIENQMGAYTIDDELSLIANWDVLDDLMSQFMFY